MGIKRIIALSNGANIHNQNDYAVRYSSYNGHLDVVKYLVSQGMLLDDYELFLAGHSFGGVISANLLSLYEQYELPQPKGALIAEGGTGPFTGAMLDHYDEIDEEIVI